MLAFAFFVVFFGYCDARESDKNIRVPHSRSVSGGSVKEENTAIASVK